MTPATYFQVSQGKKVCVCMKGKEMRRKGERTGKNTFDSVSLKATALKEILSTSNVYSLGKRNPLSEYILMR